MDDLDLYIKRIKNGDFELRMSIREGISYLMAKHATFDSAQRHMIEILGIEEVSTSGFELMTDESGTTIYGMFDANYYDEEPYDDIDLNL